ncbi:MULTISPECIES: mycofactocin-coupled SDR family oxidoreductase [Nocardiaceae]|uniref:SDR family mycofactocin-dependent oxidoreductase n=1 Tax=Rhodococcoides corynebacterioides TaxID=53972 RepID=A0ABS2L0R1_9NOCA|nr:MULTISPECIES: mycofactocin-coupled SDR family oxidoreductase [Rhodococcus]MBM7417470.1 SDR family mycofactocin-dependent oxidoreductase [Rhodococcus corynebacterioides]MBP1115724.1 SDR family mycofactocin-dependent oxidoreductase [Rhodococcus sp. PvP016]
MPGRVEGKVAFITGAARGQGRSHAFRLAEEGADIIAVDVMDDVDTVSYPMATAADMAETVRGVEARGRKIVSTRADVRDYHSLEQAVAAGVAELGRLDIVSANAGIFSFGSATELDEATWHQMIDINLSGVWRTVKAAIPTMVAQGTGGSIVLTSSVAGLRGFGRTGHYVAAKHGVVGLMKTLAHELAEHAIRVNTVHPTQVDTPMAQNQKMYDAFSPHLAHPTRDDFATASSATILLPIPWVEDLDISNAVLFLASDEARYITGTSLPIDGGAAIK